MSESIQHIIDSGDSFRLYCDNPDCRHHAPLDYRVVRDRLGPDHDGLWPAIAHLFRCERCGEKKRLSITRSPPGSGWPLSESARQQGG